MSTIGMILLVQTGSIPESLSLNAAAYSFIESGCPNKLPLWSVVACFEGVDASYFFELYSCASFNYLHVTLLGMLLTETRELFCYKSWLFWKEFCNKSLFSKLLFYPFYEYYLCGLGKNLGCCLLCYYSLVTFRIRFPLLDWSFIAKCCCCTASASFFGFSRLVWGSLITCCPFLEYC